MKIPVSLNSAYLLAGIVLGVAILMLFLVYRPMYNTLSVERQKGEELEKTVAERRAFLAALDSKKAALETQAINERTVRVALPEEEEVEDVIRIVERAAITAGGGVRTFRNTSVEEQRDARVRQSPGALPPLPPFTVLMGARVEFVGSYQQLRVFLNELNSAPRLLDVTSLDITRSSTVSDVITAQLNIRFYHYGSNDV